MTISQIVIKFDVFPVFVVVILDTVLYSVNLVHKFSQNKVVALIKYDIYI